MKKTPQTRLSAARRISSVLLALGMVGLTTTVSQAALTGADLGTPTLKGSHTFNVDGTITVKGGGADIWGTADAGYYLYQPISGNFDVKVRVVSLEGPDAWTKAELMVRVPAGSAPTAGDPHFATMTTRSAGQNDIGMQMRPARGGESFNPGPTTDPTYPNTWLRLQRIGASYISYTSADGTTWTTLGTNTVERTDWDAGFGGDPVFIGLAVTAHNDGDANGATAVFADFEGLPPDTAPTLLAGGNAAGFTLSVVDGAVGAHVSAITSVLLDGTEVRPAMTVATVNATTIRGTYKTTHPVYLAPGAHTLNVTVTEGGSPVDYTVSFIVNNYVSVPPSRKLQGTPASPGIAYDLYQMNFVRLGGGNENFLVNAEQQWARGYINPATQQPYPNVNDPATMQSVISSVNLNGAIDSSWLPTTGAGQIGSFQDPLFETGAADNYIPGLPGATASDPRSGTENGFKFNNIVAEMGAFVTLPVGLHRWAINSDDGFKVSLGSSLKDVDGLVVGLFNGGKGASDVSFDFVIEEAGNYAVRLLWWQGNGGANVEWLTINPDTGVKTLVNQTTGWDYRDGTPVSVDPAALKAFTSGVGTKAHIVSVLPANGYQNAATNVTVRITLANGSGAGATTVVAGQTKLYVDDELVVNNGGATINYVIPKKLAFNSVHTNILVWTESPAVVHTNVFSFRVKSFGVDDLSVPGSFLVEIEDFDYNRGQFQASASVMPYWGGHYAGLGPAIFNVDYFLSYNSADAGSQAAYRSAAAGLYQTVDGVSNFGPSFASEGAVTRPGQSTTYNLTNNFKIGWGGTHWFNFTRTIPRGVYTAAMSTSRDPAALINHTLAEVTSGVGTATQTTRLLGTFRGTPPGGWSVWGLLPMVDAAGNTTFFKLPGGQTTLRYTQTANEGDMDWFVLVPVSTVGPQVTTSVPALPGIVPRLPTIVWTLEDYSAALAPATVSLSLDGVAVPTSELAVAPVAAQPGFNTVTWTRATPLTVGKTYNYTLNASDVGGNAGGSEGTLTIGVIGITGSSPNLAHSIRRDAVLTWTLQDPVGNPPINPGSVVLMIDGATVAHTLTATTNAGQNIVSYDPPGLLSIGEIHTFSLAYADSEGNAGAPRSGTFMANYMPSTPAGAFLIESEDYDTGGGLFQAAANTMPYLGNAYSGLSTVNGIDAQRAHSADGNSLYRVVGAVTNDNPRVPMNVSMSPTNGVDLRQLRAIWADGTSWIMETNMNIGWSAGGQWANYTRTIPAGNYTIWGGQSYGGSGAADIATSVQWISAGAGTSNQTVTALGNFRAPGNQYNGGWGVSVLVPLRTDEGQTNSASVFALPGGDTTLRWTQGSGDLDYLMLIPVEEVADQPTLENPTINAGGQIVITFSNGTLESTATLPATSWTTVDTAGATPKTVTLAPPAAGANVFYQVRGQ